MGIYKRKDSRCWYFNFTFDSKRYNGSTGEISKLKAQKFLEDLKYSIKTGNKKRVKEISFNEFAREYLKLHAEQKRGKEFFYFTVRKLTGFFGSQFLTNIEQKDIEQYVAKRLKKVKPSTVNRETSVLKHMFNKAIDWDYLVDNPGKKIKKFKEKNRREYFLTRKEAERLISFCPKWLRPLVIVALETGARRGELLALAWADIDFASKTILFRQTKNDEIKRVPMSNSVEAVLKGLRTRFKGDHVFSNFSGEKLTAEAMRKPFEHAVKRSGLTGFRFHDLRHSFASFLVKAGVPLNTVRELLGHKSIEMTLRYSHLSPGHKKQAIDTLTEILCFNSTTGPNFPEKSEEGRSAQVIEKNGAEEEGRTPTGINAH